MAELIPTGSIITEAMITDWQTRYSRTRAQAIADLDDIENGRQELPPNLPSTYNALVSSYAGAVEKNRGTPPRPSTLAAVVAAAAAVASLVFGAITVTSLQSNTTIIGPTLQATSTAESAIQSAGGIQASSTIQGLTVSSTNAIFTTATTTNAIITNLTGTNITATTLASSTELVVSGTSTMRQLQLGEHTVADLYLQAPFFLHYTPSQIQADNFAPSISIRNASSTLFSGIEFKNAAFSGSVGSILAYNESAPSEMGLSLANKLMMTSTSGTFMIVGEGTGMAYQDELGVFRPISGLGFGGGLAGLGSAASTTVSDGNSVIATLDFPAVSAATCSSPLPITLVGLNATDTVMLAGAGMGTLHNLAGVSTIQAYASTTDIVAVKVCNVTASPSADLPAVQFRASYLRFE